MIKYLLLFLLPFSIVYASKILSYNIYDRTDRADVMITFDTPYDSVIKQNTSTSKIIIKLEGASIESSKYKKTDSKFLNSINIVPGSNQIQIIASVPQNIKLVASRTADAYGLRLRFVSNSTLKKNSSTKIEQLKSQEFSNTLPTKKTDNMSTSYYIVVTILVVGIFILFIIRKRMIVTNPQKPQQNSTWLFKENLQGKLTDNASSVNQDNNLISIRFQKAIDTENSVVMLDFGKQSYLVLMGKSNILLDKFTDDKPTTQEDFDSILQSRHQELENFLNKETPSTNDSKEALQAYKERAASMIYES